jgi:hypothetical protein
MVTIDWCRWKIHALRRGVHEVAEVVRATAGRS